MTSPLAGPPAPPPPQRRAGIDRRASGQMLLPQVPRLGMMRGLGLYAALFGGVLMLLLVAVVLEDMALRDALRIHAENDAAAVAAELEGAVALRIAAARGFQGMYAAGGTPGPYGAGERFRRLVQLVGAPPAPLFERIVVRDVASEIVHDTVLTAASRRATPVDSTVPATVVPDSLSADSATADSTAAQVKAPDALAAELAALAARDTAGSAAPQPGHPRAVPIASVPGMMAIVVPLAGDSGVAGTFAGAVRMASLASGAIAHGADRRSRFIVLAGGDTLLVHGDAVEGSTRVATANAQVRAANPWSVLVIHEDTAPGVRATLWLLGSSAVLFLILGLARERRQADHVAERSAELERLSTELLRSNRMKSEFLANVSHELRTPLNAIVGFVELLRDGVYGELSPRQTNPVERIAGSATHLRHLVDQVLDIAKMAAGRLEVHLESVVLRPFVLNVASELESLAADKGIVLSLTVGSSLPRVRTDPSHLRQILVNLVGNAIKYTPSGGAVAIRTRLVGVPGVVLRGATPAAGSVALPVDASAMGARAADDEPAPPTLAARSPDPARPWVAVQVSDTGIGIAPADHDRIFEEFEQVNAGPRGESMERGTGLGLPISRRLARLLGGDVSVDSGLGRGATFTLWLPLDVVPPGEHRR